MDINTAAANSHHLSQLKEPDTHLRLCRPPPKKKTATMNRNSYLRPLSMMAMSGRAKQARGAQEMARAVEERARKHKVKPPPYEFLELIGKGSFGRVFKSRRNSDKSLVAVKVIDVDSADYKMSADQKDQAIKDFFNEISIMQTLKDSKAKNINVIHDTFNFHSQLWIISDYCPGGSVHTLMRAFKGSGLEEKYLIPIARELAVALKYVHEAGIIHRDIKCGNILITEDGRLQLCDFGVSGILESQASKRTTIVGTPYWMPPEMFEENPSDYGTEIDCWAYGCTIYEMACGQPPNAKIAAERLHMFLQKAPRLEGDQYPEPLKEFVAFCLQVDRKTRPNADVILRHTYVANSEKKHPTGVLGQLIEEYAAWETAGGQRASLWQPGGAAAPLPLAPTDDETEDDEWNFSTTDSFAEELISRFWPEETQNSADLQPPLSAHGMTPVERAKQEARAQRGANRLARAFNTEGEEYRYSFAPKSDEPESDLLFRRSTLFQQDTDNVIDLDEARASQDLSGMIIDGVDTVRAKRTNTNFINLWDDDEEEPQQHEESQYYQDQGGKRATREWKFPLQNTMPARPARPALKWSMDQAQQDAGVAMNTGLEDDSQDDVRAAPPQRPMLKHTVTEPVGNFADFVHSDLANNSYGFDEDTSGIQLSLEPPDRDSMIDMGEDLPSNFTGRPFPRQPSTASSLSAHSIMTDTTDGEAFPLEAFEERTVRGKQDPDRRASMHAHSQSEPTAGDRSSNDFAADPHTRSSSLTSELLELDRHQRERSDVRGRTRTSRAFDEALQQEDVPRNSSDFWRQAEDGTFCKCRSVRCRPRIQYIAHSSFICIHCRSILRVFLSSCFGLYANAFLNADYPSSGQHQHPGQLVTPPHSRKASHRGRRRMESDADSDASAFGLPRTRRQYRSQQPQILPFPQPQPPNPAALIDGCDQNLISYEFDRLMEDYLMGLQQVDQLLSREQEHHGPPVPPKNHINGHQRGMESGSGGSGSSRGNYARSNYS